MNYLFKQTTTNTTHFLPTDQQMLPAAAAADTSHLTRPSF